MSERMVETRRTMRQLSEILVAAAHSVPPRARFWAGLGINLSGAMLLFCQAIALITPSL